MKHRLIFACIAGALAVGLITGCKPKEGGEGGNTAGATAAWVPEKNIEWFDASEGATVDRPVSNGAGTTQEGDTIKVGLIASLSGSEKPWGDESKKGAELAIAQVNAEGGINGKQIELISEDTGGQPASGKTATERLIGKNVLAVLGE